MKEKRRVEKRIKGGIVADVELLVNMFLGRPQTIPLISGCNRYIPYLFNSRLHFIGGLGGKRVVIQLMCQKTFTSIWHFTSIIQKLSISFRSFC